MIPSQMPAPFAPLPDDFAAEEDRHRRLAAAAHPIGGVCAIAHYFGLTIRDLEAVTWRLNPDTDDEAAVASDPRALDQLRRWHAAWLALEEKYRVRDEARRRRENAQRRRDLAFAASISSPFVAIGGAR